MNPPNCRFCQSPLATTMADLGIASPPNQPQHTDADTATQRAQALNVFICDNCFLVQSPNYRFDRPFFVSDDHAVSSRQTRDSHYTDMMIDRFGLTSENLVIQHDSIEDDFLPNFQRANIPVLGIQPYPHINHLDCRNDIPSIAEPFGGDVAERLTAEHKQADLFISHNSLGHVPDLNDFVLGIQTVLKPDGVFTLEFPHLLRRMQQNPRIPSHHPVTYFSFLTVEKIFSQHGLTLFDVEEIPAHGGSLRVFGRHDDHHEHAITPKILTLRDQEKAAGLDKLETYQNFGQRANGQN